MLGSSRYRFLGYGIGLRSPHYGELLERPAKVGWFEAISENFMVAGGRPLQILERVRRDYPLVLHGVSMSLGSTDPLDQNHLRRLKDLALRFEPEWISDHLCWSGVDAHNLHDLLPLPYTEEALEHVAGRIRQVSDILGRPMVIENVSSYLAYSHSTLTEWEFLGELTRRADCDLLLDVNNVYVSSRNHGFDPWDFIAAIPGERIAQIHLAGHTDYGTHVLDTHDHPVRSEVWELYARTIRHFGARSTLIEWDGNIPDLARVEEEAATAQHHAEIALAQAAA